MWRPVSLVAAATLTAVVAAGLASGGSTADRLIRPGVGIGKVRLGMNLAQVRRTLGNEFIVNRRRPRGFGRTYVELGWDHAWWRVGFIVSRGRYRAVLVSTRHRSERTRGGVGVGTTSRTLRRKLPVRCPPARPPRDTTPPFGEPDLRPRGCILGASDARHTVFTVGLVCTRARLRTSRRAGIARAAAAAARSSRCTSSSPSSRWVLTKRGFRGTA